MLHIFMASASVASANAVWFLVGPFDSGETVDLRVSLHDWAAPGPAPVAVLQDRFLSATVQRQQVVATLVQMVRNLGIIALAEGVETEAEDAACRQMGFDLGQGYLFGRPAPPRSA